ncbi:TolC family protein [Williamwhitmania taraxaci]|uniref:Outer membrane protein TolC n=1 Tax=Williamwhitmania taraxaci TaxID=1640674 RepID=A0A1G6NHT9_9BACT|nr:TolC family protein [Williamwhitmania taraxaci]SDC67472.1 Outer membrane protein TolC [Williamwhitmania taraxaci]
MIRKLVLLLITVSFFCIGFTPADGQTVYTLERALDVAGNQSPDIIQSLLNLERFKESLNAQRAGLKSKFQLNVTPIEYENSRNFNSTYSTWINTESTTSSGTFSIVQPILPTDATVSLNNNAAWRKNYSDFSKTETKSYSNNLYLNIQQPLFTYNKRKMELRELELDYEKANLNYSMQRLNLEKNVSQYFYNLFLAQKNLTIAEDELEKTQKSYEIIENKVSAGLAAKEQFYQAELNLMNAKSGLENRKVDRENIQDDFKLYVGIPFSEEAIALADISVNPVVIDVDFAVRQALSARMELRQRQIDIENSQFDLIRTQALNEFKGDVNLSLGLMGDNPKAANVYETPSTSPKVSISFNIPIYDWGEKKARVKAQQAVVKSSELNLGTEQKQIELNIRKIHRSLKNQLNQIDIARQNEKNAQLTYEINLERYRNGDLTSMDLKLYQNQLSEKKMSLLQAQIDYKQGLLNMKIQTLYDFENQRAIVPTSESQVKQ